MIAHIKGSIVSINPNLVILEAANIGYEIHISNNTYHSIKENNECILLTYLQIKEDSHTLFGFISESEKKCFLALKSVKGVGSNAALSILSELKLEDLISGIINGDHILIKSVKGIGEKIAKRIILELKDKINKIKFDNLSIADNENVSKNYKVIDEALAALTKLGFSKSGAEKIILDIIKKEGSTIDTEKIIKLALNSVS